VSELRKRIAGLTPEQRLRLEERLRERGTGNGRLGPRPVDAEPRPSFGQERLWRLSRLLGDSTAYNMSSSYRLRGRLDVEALRAALEAVVETNEQLRTIFSPDDGNPVTLPSRPFDLVVSDLTADPTPMATIADWIERPLDVSTGPLFSARLWRLAVDRHVFSILTHHIICDGWSMGIIERQLSDGYAGAPMKFSGARIDYADFVAWERAREASLQDSLDHWRSRLVGASALRLPGERSSGSGVVSLELPAAVSTAVDDVARQARATPFMVLLAIFAATLNRRTGQDDLVVCTPVAGRSDPALEQVVGYFNDLVPIRGRLGGDPDLWTLVARLREDVLEAVEHMVPFQWIATLTEVRSTPLARALFALNDVPAGGLVLPGLSVEPVHMPVAGSDFELGWFMSSVNGRYAGTVHHRASSAGAVERLAADFASLAELLTSNPDMRLSQLPDRVQSAPPVDALPIGSRPTSLLESRLLQIWERVFSRPVGVDDDFFELGGHSLLAAELIAEIEAELSSERIPLATLFAAPTVGRLAELLEAGDWGGAWASLVPIKPTGDRPPLFFVHGHGGNVIGFSDLGRRLSPEQPLYGLQAPHMDVDGGSLRIEDMARTYVEEIRTVQPMGPYVVGGWCLGGDVAFEMAQQLRRDGSEVALVLMVDNTRKDDSDALRSGPARILLGVATRLAMEWSNLAEVPRGHRGEYAVERTARLERRLLPALERLISDDDGTLPFGLSHSRPYRQEQIAAMHEKAYEDYRPQPYPGAVAIFRAQRRPYGRRLDPSLGWSSLVQGPLMLFELPGHRIGLLTEPRVRHIVPVVEAAIRTALERFESGGE